MLPVHMLSLPYTQPSPNYVEGSLYLVLLYVEVDVRSSAHKILEVDKVFVGLHDNRSLANFASSHTRPLPSKDESVCCTSRSLIIDSTLQR